MHVSSDSVISQGQMHRYLAAALALMFCSLPLTNGVVVQSLTLFITKPGQLEKAKDKKEPLSHEGTPRSPLAHAGAIASASTSGSGTSKFQTTGSFASRPVYHTDDLAAAADEVKQRVEETREQHRQMTQSLRAPIPDSTRKTLGEAKLVGASVSFVKDEKESTSTSTSTGPGTYLLHPFAQKLRDNE